MDSNKITKYQLERKISDMIHKDNKCTAHFMWEYKPKGNYGDVVNIIGSLELKVVTLNPAHETHFLLHQISKNLYDNVNIEDLYCKILQEVINILEKKKDSTIFHYAISWRDISNDALKFNTVNSYFSGKNFKEIMEKFFFEKCEDNIIIDGITLLPDT